ncbi:MAG: class I SAM-dependent methyltransferase [Bryobacteraceae bacterium]
MDPQTLAQMRADWNARASEDANYYVAFGRREQDDEEFFATAGDVLRDLESQLPRLPGRDAALEIGCGPGRLLRPMSRHFGEIHGVDVSDEMIRLATERLRDTPNAHPHHGSGAGLELFSDNHFDLVYSYAVFQHIPSRDVVFRYLAEAHRVLKPGGVLRCQLNGLPPHARQYDTWSGVRVTPGEVAQFARESGFQLLALDPIWTQYMWITCRKRGAGTPPDAGPARIRNITNAITGEAAAPVTGPMAALSLWIENLPSGCDLNSLAIGADGRACRVSYVGEPAHDRVTQVNAALPEGVRTGLVAVEAFIDGQPLCPSAWVRIIPAGPPTPHVASIGDGVNLISGSVVASGMLKAVLVEVERADEFRAAFDEQPVKDIDAFCVDPLFQRYEFNFPVPPGVTRGRHEIRMWLGRRAFAPVVVEVL